MNIYLAGKVCERFGSWRDELLTDGRNGWQAEAVDSDDGPVVHPWRVRERIVLGCHDYAGPFRVTFNSNHWSNIGIFHGVETFGSHGYIGCGFTERRIITEVLRAIDRSDLLFAYINSPDAFGTLAEIGYARAKGKFVAVVVHPDAQWDWRDYWFVETMADFSTVASDLPAEPKVQVRERLMGAIVAYAAVDRTPQTAIAPTQDHSLTTLNAIQSFQQIARWTSDPRVRDEATRMINVLGRSR